VFAEEEEEEEEEMQWFPRKVYRALTQF